ncbi:protein RD3-like [Anneissia japonica]|uniref:protein RD3-like n=1 Tax=Anneissia japonica TaxID=1529436 RepID=UPI001425B01C|nr:protein RD3-like [Anneissia japonica]
MNLFKVEKKLPSKSDVEIVQDCLITELEQQIQDIEELEKQEKEAIEKASKCSYQADYSWLANRTIQHYQIPVLQKLQIEELCLSVKPSETRQIILRFRTLMTRRPPLEEVALIMISVIKQVLQERNKEESFSEWLVRRSSSFVSLRSNTRRVSPVNDPSEGPTEPRRRQECFNSNSIQITYCNNVDDLPV